MPSKKNRVMLAVTLACAGAFAMLPACSTAPRSGDQASVSSNARSNTTWFKSNVSGLDSQLSNSAGYTSFPSVGQYGLGIGGGKFGRGAVFNASGTQIGWAYINTGSAGLQIGVQGFKMLVVYEDAATMRQFQQNQLTGNVGAVAVIAEEGSSGAASFTDGVAVYQGGNTGLMAGASIGLDYMRYEPF